MNVQENSIMCAWPIGYRSQQVLEYIERVVERDTIAPTYGMIADEFMLSRAEVSRIVTRLENRGLVKRLPVTRRKSMGWHKPIIVLCR